MLYIGDWNKQEIIDEYIDDHDIKKVLVVFSKETKTNYDFSIPIEEVEYHDAIEYVYYYHLLEYVDKWTLVVIDNCLKDKHRNALENNCINTISNNSPHHLVFNYLPIVNDITDFMVLMDFNEKARHHIEQFRPNMICEDDVMVKEVPMSFDFIEIEVDDKDFAKYEKKKKSLFDGLGRTGDPDVVPNNLSLLAGDVRASRMDLTDGIYLARNQRFKSENVKTYKDMIMGRIIDFPIKRMELVNLITNTKQTDIEVTTSKLKIDVWKKNDYNNWTKKLVEFYGYANLY